MSGPSRTVPDPGQRGGYATLLGMTDVRSAANADAARWLLHPDVSWWDLARYGPPGFDAYVRVAFADGSTSDPGEGDQSLRTALATLADHTTTPSDGYAAIWEGWGVDPIPAAPRVEIPNRTMLLFTGAVEVLRDAPALAWFGTTQGGPEPSLVWPEDHAWCLACEVDEEIEFTVGCGLAAAEALAAALPGAVRRVAYGERAPLYLDE